MISLPPLPGMFRTRTELPANQNVTAMQTIAQKAADAVRKKAAQAVGKSQTILTTLSSPRTTLLG